MKYLFYLLILNFIKNFNFELQEKDHNQCYFIHKNNIKDNINLKFRIFSKKSGHSLNYKFTIYNNKNKELVTIKNKNPPTNGFDLSKYNDVDEFKVCWFNIDEHIKIIDFHYKVENFDAAKEKDFSRIISNMIELKSIISYFDNSIYSFLNRSLDHERLTNNSNSNLKSITVIKLIIFSLIMSFQIIFLKKYVIKTNKYTGVI